MSLGLKGRRVYLKKGYRADGAIVHGVITDALIWVKVELESGNIAMIEEANVAFDIKKRGKGK
jgi:hypothetical protein